jgi:hypothetical protein
VLFCIVPARFVATSMSRLLRSRRGKDLAVFLVLPIFALYELFTPVVPKATAEGKLAPAAFAGADAWMRWTPPGLALYPRRTRPLAVGLLAASRRAISRRYACACCLIQDPPECRRPA